MSQNVTFNGQVYVIPDLADNNWGQNVTDYLVALPQGALQKTGGAFTLAADVDFGASFGLKSAYFKTRASNPASAGLVRLANTDTVVWRNAGNSGDLALAVNGSNQLTFNGVILESDVLPSAYIFVGNASNESTGVPMTGDIGIDNTGLTSIQNGVIINTDINASAAIAVSKLAALTASKSLVSDGSGIITTGWGYASGDMTTTANGALRFQDSAGGDYVGFVAPAAVTTHTYLLPIAAGLNGQVLSWTTGGQLAWINASGTGTINSGTAGRFAYYAGAGTTLSDQTALVTDGSTYVAFPVGSATNPGLAIQGTLGTGLYSVGTNILGVATNGAHRWNFNAIGDFVIAASSAGQILAGQGSAATPAYSFNVSGQTDTGMYNPANDAIGFSTGGAIKFEVGSALNISYQDLIPGTTNTKTLGSTSYAWKNIYLGDGTAALPAVSFTSDPNTGLYSGGADVLSFSTGGVSRGRFSSTEFEVDTRIAVAVGSATNPSYAFTGEANTGIYSGGSDNLSFTTGGVQCGYFTTSIFSIGSTIHIENSPGSISSPSYSFYSEPGLGWYRSTTGAMTLAYNSTNLVNFRGVSGDARFGVLIRGASGDASSPSYSFTSDEDTGIYNASANNFSIATGGTVGFQVDNSYVYINSGRQFVAQDGTSSAPGISFLSDTDTGIYRAATNRVGVGAGGTEYLTIGNTGASGAIHSGVVGGFSNVINSAGNVAVFYATNNDNTNGNSHAAVLLKTGGASGGDPKVTFEISAITGWSMGIDNSDADIFCIDDSSSVLVASTSAFALNTASTQIIGQAGTAANPYYSFYSYTGHGMWAGSSSLNWSISGTSYLQLTSTTLQPQGTTGTINLGNATNYWNDVSYKTITDRGCLPWCDEGVEMADGSIVSDLEAISRLEKHPTKKTVHGLPMLNYKTFPKKAYRPADENGVLIARDANGEPVKGSDGIEMTMMFGVMFGAIKELKAQIEELKKGK